VCIAQIRLGKFEEGRLRIGPVAKLFENMLKVPIPKREFCNTSAKVSISMKHRIREEDIRLFKKWDFILKKLLNFPFYKITELFKLSFPPNHGIL